MQKIRRLRLGAKHLVRVDRRRRFRFPLGNAGEFYEGIKVGVPARFIPLPTNPPV